MPRIQSYEIQTQVGGQLGRANRSADEFGAIEARVGQANAEAFKGAVDKVQKRVEQGEIADASVKLSEIQNKYATQMDESVRRGDFDSEKFLEEYNREVDDYKNGLLTSKGQDYFNQSSTRLSGDFTRSAMQSQATLAGIKATEDYQKSYNNFTNAITRNPFSYETTREIHDAQVDSLVESGQIDFASAEKIKLQATKDFAITSVLAQAKTDPEYAKEVLSSGEFDSQLDAKEKRNLFSQIEQAQRAEELEKARLKKVQEEELQAAQEATKNIFLAKMQDRKLSAKEILDSNLNAASKKEYLNMLESDLEEPIKTNNQVYSSLLERIYAPDGDPSKIVNPDELNKYVINRQLTKSDLNFLRSEISGDKDSYQNTMKNALLQYAKSKMTKTNKMLGIADPEGDYNYSQFLHYFTKAYQEGRAAGRSHEDLLSPFSPDYLGKVVPNYVKTGSQLMNEMADSMRPRPLVEPPSFNTEDAPPARIPGETFEEYDARVNKK